MSIHFSNVTLFISALLLSVCGAVLLYKKWAKLNVFDFYIMVVCLYFGLWGMLDSLIQNLAGYNSLPIFLGYLIVLLPLVTVWICIHYLRQSITMGKIIAYLDFEEISKKIQVINPFIILIFVLCLVYFTQFSATHYHFIRDYTIADLQATNIQLPILFKALYALYRPLIFVAATLTAFQLFANQKVSNRVILLSSAIIVFALAAIMGRGAYLHYWLIFYVAYIVSRKVKMFSFKSILFIVLIFCSAYLYSNVFESIKVSFRLSAPELISAAQPKTASKNEPQAFEGSNPQTSNTQGIVKQEPQAFEGSNPQSSHTSQGILNKLTDNLTHISKQKGIIGTAFLSKRTTSNLKVRPTQWEFNYAIINQQLLKGYYNAIPYGGIFVDAIKFIIPRELWKSKPIHLQAAIRDRFGLHYKRFFPSNLFAFIQSDFGFLSLLITPLFLLFSLLVTAFLFERTQNRPTLFGFIAGLSVYWNLNVPIGYDGYFYYFRDIIIIIFCYFIISLLLNKLTLFYKPIGTR